ncbi:MAG TPA: DJ-1/PfpI family protein [Hanamia sp.]|nr:DJ-1/PfpI family protein [Hanamia sp.]
MKKIKKALIYGFTALLALVAVLYFTLSPVVAQKLKVFKDQPCFPLEQKKIDSSKKTIFIIADNNGTELFDLIAPFYLFNATEQANVLVVSEKKAPILLVNALFILPHYTFAEIDSLDITADVIVIPNITVHLKTPPKESTVNWIKKQVTQKTIVLSICDGSATAAATGLYDGKPITTHASDFKTLKKHFPKPHWVKDISVTESGNLYSTAGVSNAVEGSLTVIKRVFGEESMQKVLHNIKYPHADIQIDHKSEIVSTGAIFRIVSKVVFRKNYKIGVQLQDNINEFELASLLDTYTRTFPSSLNTYSVNGNKITSKYGLTMYPTGVQPNKVNELHLLNTPIPSHQQMFTNANTIKYDSTINKYPIDLYLERISGLYGNSFKNCVKLTLDYN